VVQKEKIKGGSHPIANKRPQRFKEKNKKKENRGGAATAFDPATLTGEKKKCERR